ncbi:MAG: ribonuclease J, partial [Chloroflexota bacterium]
MEIARQTGRHLVVLPRDAYLLRALHLLDPEVPDVGIDPRLRIYQELRVSSRGWERKIYAEYKSKLVSAEEVHRHQEDYILCFSFFDINELVSIQPRPGSTYLYSTSEPHGEEGWLDA